MARPRDIGTAAETAVVRHLVGNGWPYAERRSLKGAYDQGDITGTPGLAWEVKGGDMARKASDLQIHGWLEETEAERHNARADYGILVVQRKGFGAARAGLWWAILQLFDVAALTQLSLDPVLGSWPDEAWRIKPAPAPVRLRLVDACILLRAAGYGNPLNVEAAAR